jgi:hypothetical integral membrane protein (TIGR02206 family)
MPAQVPDTFATFSALHLAAVAATLAVAVPLSVRRRRMRLAGDPEAGRLDVQLSAVLLAVWVLEQVLELLPSRYSIHESLPIHICDVTALVGAFAVRATRRLPRAMLYYWGLALSSQAVIQPDLTHGPTTMTFWVFWVPHGGIVVAALYDLVGRGFRPTWRDFAVVCGTLAVYVAAVMPIDLWLNVDYGFVGSVPGGPIDFLGPWPLRVYKAAVAVAVTLAAMTAVWPAARRLRRRFRREPPHGAIAPTPAAPRAVPSSS